MCKGFDRNEAEKILRDNCQMTKFKDCRDGFTSYKHKDKKKVILYIGWELNPKPVYIVDPQRQIKSIFPGRKNAGRKMRGMGQLVSRVTDNLFDLTSLSSFASQAININ